MNKSFDVCDGCDREATLVEVRGRGLCINCQVLWNAAQKAMVKEVIGFIESKWPDIPIKFDIVNELKQKYEVKDE